MAGRKPKPTALKELQGNPGKRSLNKHEPRPKEGNPSMPNYWKGDRFAEARREWRHITRGLPPGLLTKADRSMLELYCVLVSNVRCGIMRGITPTPSMISQIRALAASFGLEPSSRSRLSVVQPESVSDPFEELLKGGNRN